MKWESEVDSTFTLKSRVYTRLLLCRCEKSSRREVKWESEVDSTFTLPLWKVESERSEVRKWGRLDFYSAVVKSRVYTRLLLRRCEKSSRREVKWESEVDSTFTLPLWKVESERSEVRKWGRLNFYSAVVKSRVYTRLLLCRCEKSSRREVKWESEVDSTFTLPLWKVESILDFYSAVVKSRVGEKWNEMVRKTRLLLCRCEKSSLYSTFTLPLWKVESERSEVRKWGRLDFSSAVVKSRVGEKWSEKVR